MYFLLRCECAHCTSLVSQTAFEFVIRATIESFIFLDCLLPLHFAILCSSLLQSNLRACHKLYPSSDELQFPDSSYGFSRYCDSKLLNKTYPRRLISQTLPSPDPHPHFQSSFKTNNHCSALCPTSETDKFP